MRRHARFDAIQPPVVPLTEYATFEEALAKTGGLEPFLIPQCREFNVDVAKLESILQHETQPVMGYDRVTAQERHIDARDALHMLRTNTLGISIADSPITSIGDVFPSNTSTFNEKTWFLFC